MLKIALTTLAAAVLALPASAAVTLVTTQTSDAAFEGPGGFLQTYYGLPLVNGSALPPLERAVGQVKIGANKRQGLYVPTAATGIPAPVGTGVTQALTNVAPLAGGADTPDWVSGSPVAFSFSRTGNTVTYTVGGNSWSDTQVYYGQVNGFEARIRSNSGAANALTLGNLVYSDATTPGQSLGTISAADGAVLIKLWNGATGDFTVTGDYTFTWTAGARPGGAALASQLKLLELPVVPEPSTWAMMIAGFGLVGAAMRRRPATVTA